MNAITQEINLNLIPGAIPPRISVSQYDDASRSLVFRLYNGAVSFAPGSGTTAQIRGTKPDNKGFEYAANLSGSTVTAAITEQMTAVAGDVRCEIILKDSTKTIGTGNFVLEVERAALGEDTDISETVIPDIIDAAEANAERAEAAAAIAEAADLHPPYIGENDNWYVFDVSSEQYVDSGVDARGDDGEDGTSIANITKTGSSGLVDTYTVTLTDGTTYTFTVTNGQNGTDGQDGQDGADGEDGVGIADIEKTSTVGLVDTYTITLTDGTTYTFTVTNGQNAIPGGGTTGQVLTKLSDTSGDAGWQDPASGASTLAGLSDTNIVSPTDQQYLKYDAVSGKWVNVSAAKKIVKATPNMAGYTTPSGVVSASSEYNGNYAAWYAFDGTYGNDQQTWASGAGLTTGEWIQYLFDSAKVIKKIATVNRNEGNPRAIKTFKFQGSNDGTTFTDIASCEIASGTGGYRQEFTINNDTAYLYYRLYVTEPWIPNDMTVGLAELELFEEVEVEVAELDDLVDVDLSALTDGQALVYDNSLGKWTNSAVGVAGGGTGNSSGYVRIGQKENTSIGAHATAEGTNNTATGDDAHTEGYNNTASQPHTHAEGEACQATEWWAHAEGFQSVASGRVSHAEGNATTASAYYAHSEGNATHAYGNSSHAEGDWTTASGADSHAQNANTTASGAKSSAAGYYTTAGYENQFVFGKYNNNKSTDIFEIGNGADNNNRSNALELDTSGNLKVAGTITDGNGNVLGAGGVPVVWDSATSGGSVLCLPMSVSEVPTLTEGGLYVLKVKGDFVAYDNQNTGRTSWGLSMTISGTTTTWANCLASGVDGTGAYLPFTPDIHVGDVITLLCVDATTPKFLVLSSNKDKEYCEATVTTSTSNDVVATFYNVGITANSEIEVGTSGWGIVPSDVTVTAGVCTVTIPKVDSAQSITVRIYVR